MKETKQTPAKAKRKARKPFPYPDRLQRAVLERRYAVTGYGCYKAIVYRDGQIDWEQSDLA